MESFSKFSHYERLAKNLTYEIDRILVYPLMLCFGIAKVVIHGEENLENLGPCLILPKHCYNADVPAIAYALLRNGFRINYVSKTFNPFLDIIIAPLGARRVFQREDVVQEFLSYAKSNGSVNSNKLMERKRGIVAKARSINQETMRALQESYTRGEVVVSHPEHGKYIGRLGNIFPDEVLRTIMKFFYEDKSISLVPVGVEYDAPPSFFHPSTLTIRFGKKISIDEFVNNGSFDEKGLVKRIKGNIATLSGLV